MLCYNYSRDLIYKRGIGILPWTLRILQDGTHPQFINYMPDYWIYDINYFWGQLLLELEHA